MIPGPPRPRPDSRPSVPRPLRSDRRSRVVLDTAAYLAGAFDTGEQVLLLADRADTATVLDAYSACLTVNSMSHGPDNPEIRGAVDAVVLHRLAARAAAAALGAARSRPLRRPIQLPRPRLLPAGQEPARSKRAMLSVARKLTRRCHHRLRALGDEAFAAV